MEKEGDGTEKELRVGEMGPCITWEIVYHPQFGNHRSEKISISFPTQVTKLVDVIISRLSG